MNEFSWKIQLIMGPMFSGKSTELLRRINRFKIAKKVCVLVKYINDNRYDKNNICTHDQKKTEAFSCKTLSEIPKTVLDSADVIGIDEGQFFSDIVEFSDLWADKGKIVIISALDGTYKKEPFPVIAKLIPKCEGITKLFAVCMLCGKDASFSKRLTTEEGDEIIGGIEKYISVCRTCYNKTIEKKD